MSEIVKTPVRTHKSRVIVLIVSALSIVLLLLVYGAGMIAFPVLILTNQQSRNCDAALTIHKMYTSLYPGFIEDSTLLLPIEECEAYVSAAAKEKTESWREAYDAYQAYLSTYPNGLYVIEAQQHSAAVLMNLVRDQIEQEKYEEALANLNLIVASYSNTVVITDAWNLFPSVYTPWGAGLREAGDFAESEQVLNEFKTWSLTNQKSGLATDAQRELTQTYLDWGLDLQSRTQFEDAIAKFELAASADPQAQFDSALQVRSGQRRVYIEWGNGLLKQREFPAAIEKFGLAVSRADGDNDDGARDALAKGQIQWASSLSAEEDFQAALEHLELAQQSALTDSMKQSVEAAFEETYLAFSNSTGIQAKQAMKEALITVCQKHKTPDLPIFGLNKDDVRFGISEADANWSGAQVTARTPGEMHYIACVEVENEIVETRYKKQIVLYVSGGYFYTKVRQSRAQLFWNISLVEIATGEKLARETLAGGTPPPFPESEDAVGGYFYGDPPSPEELAEWFLSVIK